MWFPAHARLFGSKFIPHAYSRGPYEYILTSQHTVCDSGKGEGGGRGRGERGERDLGPYQMDNCPVQVSYHFPRRWAMILFLSFSVSKTTPAQSFLFLRPLWETVSLWLWGCIYYIIRLSPFPPPHTQGLSIFSLFLLRSFIAIWCWVTVPGLFLLCRSPSRCWGITREALLYIVV